MGQLARSWAVLAPVVLSVALVGCEPSNDIVRPSPSVSATSEPTEQPAELRSMYTPGETLLGEISSARGTQELGPFSNQTGRVAVYIRCLGAGEIVVEVRGAASLTQQCLSGENAADDPGTRNSIDVSAVESVLITGSAEDSNLWAVAVTVVPYS